MHKIIQKIDVLRLEVAKTTSRWKKSKMRKIENLTFSFFESKIFFEKKFFQEFILQALEKICFAKFRKEEYLRFHTHFQSLKKSKNWFV